MRKRISDVRQKHGSKIKEDQYTAVNKDEPPKLFDNKKPLRRKRRSGFYRSKTDRSPRLLSVYQ